MLPVDELELFLVPVVPLCFVVFVLPVPVVFPVPAAEPLPPGPVPFPPVPPAPPVGMPAPGAGLPGDVPVAPPTCANAVAPARRTVATRGQLRRVVFALTT